MPSGSLLVVDSLQQASPRSALRVLRTLALLLRRCLGSGSAGQRTFHVLSNKSIAGLDARLPDDVQLHQAEPIAYAYQDNSEDCGVITVHSLLKLCRAINNAGNQDSESPEFVAGVVQSAGLDHFAGSEAWRNELVDILLAQKVTL